MDKLINIKEDQKIFLSSFYIKNYMGYFIKNCGDSAYLVDTEDTIGFSILEIGYWEKPIEDLYTSFVNEDYRVANIGANMGYHAIKLAKISRKVFAFEPQTKMFNQLLGNVYLNDLDDNVIPFKLAIGEKEKMTSFSSEHEYFDKYGAKFNENGLRNNGGIFITEDPGDVQVVTLDSLNLDVDFILMDIEDYEYHAIIGANETIKRNLPVILFECRINQRKTLFLHLISRGYEIFEANFTDNYIAIHPDFRDYEKIKNLLKDHTEFEIKIEYRG